MDLYFSDIEERNRQYNARNSVADFENCMQIYRQLAEQAKQRVVGLYDIAYGVSKQEKLDIFPSVSQPAPVFVYIHGGYWRAQSKDDACSMAENMVKHGISVVTIEYNLCPTFTLFEIVKEIRSAIGWLYKNAHRYGIDAEQIYVCGSSAGGHLVAMLWNDQWQQHFDVPKNVIKGVVALSGLFDLKPLCDIDQNQWLKLNIEQADRLSPIHELPHPSTAAPLLLSVGELETQGFKNQTLNFYETCITQGYSQVAYLKDKGHNHFDIVNTLAEPDSDLFRAVKQMIQTNAKA